MYTRNFTINQLSLFVSILLVTLAGVSHAEPERKPNVILILTDDLGWEVPISDRYDTPNLDSMAQAGVYFPNTYSTPLCTPSRLMIMTGKYNHRNYVDFGRFPNSERDAAFGHLMKSAGYATCFAGKWQFSSGSAGELGFDRSIRADHWGSYYGDATIRIDDETMTGAEFDAIRAEYPYRPDMTYDFVIDFIVANQNEPFFVYYPMFMPHAPEEPTPDFPADGDPTDREEVFDDMIRYMDKLIGNLVTQINALGLEDDTIIMFTGDNGTSAHHVIIDGVETGGGKGKMADNGTRVPLIVKWPGQSPTGVICPDLVDFTDFYATLIEISGGTPHDQVDGVSFFPQIQGLVGTPRETAFMYYRGKSKPDTVKRRGSSWSRNVRWKLYNNGELYDTENDIRENNPFLPSTDNAERAAIRAQLQPVFGQLGVVPGRYFTRHNSGANQTDLGIKIEAEQRDQASGDEEVVSLPASGERAVGDLQSGDWIKFLNMDFSGGAQHLVFEAASGGDGGTVEVRIDSPTGTKLTEVAVTNTGGWDQFEVFRGSFTERSDTKSLYFVFKGGSGDLMIMDWFAVSHDPIQLPNVSIVSPSDAASIPSPASFTLSVTATDTDGEIRRVDFYKDNTLVYSDPSEGYSLDFTDLLTGAYTLKVRAYDNQGFTQTREININIYDLILNTLLYGEGFEAKNNFNNLDRINNQP